MSPEKPRNGLLFPEFYSLLIAAAAMDVVLTYSVLLHGGWEVNALAGQVIERFGVPGMAAFKFTLVGFILCLCEWVGRRRMEAGRFLAAVAVLGTVIPVIVGARILINIP